MEPTSREPHEDDAPESSIFHIAEGLPRFREPTFVQRAGLGFAYWILGAVSVFLVAILGYWFLTAPRLADFGSPLTTESMRLYKEASDLAFQQATSLVGLVVGNTLLPVLTFVLGHAFGTQSAQSSADLET